jgi:predicted kinase
MIFLAALLHDIGKISCTRVEDGVIVSPHHSSAGAAMARDFMWRVLGACGDEKLQSFRETVCALIRYHSFPPRAAERDDAERYFQRIACLGELAEGFNIRKLCLLEKADVLGRISENNNEWLEKVEYCLMMAEDFECADAPFAFASDAAKRAYFKGKTSWKQDEIYDTAWGEITLMAGLPGTGKDTWIKQNLPDIPMISLDVCREKLGIAPGENQGAVVAAAREEARGYLRKKQPFVWNATNILEVHRSAQISLFEDYGASVRTVFLETKWQEELRRNSERRARVPEKAIENML